MLISEHEFGGMRTLDKTLCAIPLERDSERYLKSGSHGSEAAWLDRVDVCTWMTWLRARAIASMSTAEETKRLPGAMANIISALLGKTNALPPFKDKTPQSRSAYGRHIIDEIKTFR